MLHRAGEALKAREGALTPPDTNGTKSQVSEDMEGWAGRPGVLNKEVEEGSHRWRALGW